MTSTIYVVISEVTIKIRIHSLTFLFIATNLPINTLPYLMDDLHICFTELMLRDHGINVRRKSI